MHAARTAHPVHTASPSSTAGTARRAVVAALVTAALAALSLVAGTVLGTSVAAADTAPSNGTPPTVSADVLPTVQVDGVVWAQVTVGNTVYAVGKFTSARPAGSALGQNETPRANILAYDIRTGDLLTSFDHTLNAQALSIAASPDGSRVYVGGQFSQVDGQSYYRLVAFDTATGALVTSFRPTLDAGVTALAVSSTTVYFGGSFDSVNGSNRNRLAAVSAATGATLPWAPALGAPTSAAPGVNAMVLAPDGTRLIVGGRFNSLNGTSANGMGSLDVTSGATLAWAANQTIKDGVNASGGILTLATDGTYIFGGGYAYDQVNNFEGTFAADPTTGAIVWVNDCHGDTYSVAPLGGLLYTSSHAHDCSAAGAFPTTNNPGTTVAQYWHGLAWTTAPSSKVNTGPDSYGWNFSGIHTSTLTQFFPTFAIGTATGQNQATWSVTGNSDYVAMGGEFPSVNGIAQQGLVRFAVSAIAPDKQGPRQVGTPTLTTGAAGTTVSVAAAWDRDNANLTYALVRDGNTTSPVVTSTVASTFWQLPTVSLTDPAPPTGTHTYRIDIKDPFGNLASTTTLSSTSTTTSNLALGRAATQSSTINSAPASRAVDGNTNGVFANNSVTHTSFQNTPWWQVDLGSVRTVASIKIYNRTDCCSNRLTNYWVYGSATPFNTSLSPSALAAAPGVLSSHQTGQAGSPTTITVNANARYIMVRLNGYNYLSLAEVQVLGQ